ncbi:extensin [Burkholderia sp. 4701]|nr:extensin [Burkholderia sp. 4701]MXN84588.1 extensin [Burkholderia sp. 4812]
MRNARKTLMIAGGLLVVATGTSYLMLLKADHRAMEEGTAGIAEPARTLSADVRPSDDHAAQGSIRPAPAPAAPAAPTPPTAPAKQANAAPQQPPAPAPTPADPRVTAQLQPQPQPQPKVQPQPAAQPSAPPSVTVVTIDAQDSPAPKAAPTQRTPRRRDGLERHPTPNQGTTTPETAALVRESARLDPSLPMPNLPVRSSTDQHGSSARSNAVAAAMTEQLVRQSSNIGASSPAPKDGSAAPK